MNAATLRLRLCGGLTPGTFEGGEVVGFEHGKGSIEHFPARDDDNVKSYVNLPTPKHLTAQAFCTVTIDGRPDFPGRGNPEPQRGAAIRQHKHGHETAVNPGAFLVNALEIQPATNTLGGGQCLTAHAGPDGCGYPSSATVSRRRPLARRRFRTIRPFLVDILTRKPCVFFRLRLLGW